MKIKKTNHNIEPEIKLSNIIIKEKKETKEGKNGD